MSRTHHTKNYSQGAAYEKIRSYLKELVQNFGIGHSVTEQECNRLLKKLAQLKKSLELTQQSGGLTIVLSDKSLITLYRFGSFNFNYIDPDRALLVGRSHEMEFLSHHGLVTSDRKLVSVN